MHGGQVNPGNFGGDSGSGVLDIRDTTPKSRNCFHSIQESTIHETTLQETGSSLRLRKLRDSESHAIQEAAPIRKLGGWALAGGGGGWGGGGYDDVHVTGVFMLAFSFPNHVFSVFESAAERPDLENMKKPKF